MYCCPHQLQPPRDTAVLPVTLACIYPQLPLDPPQRRRVTSDAFVPWLLALGAFFFGIGWLIGVALLWTSRTWSLRDKLLGTFVPPGGLAGSMALLSIWALFPPYVGVPFALAAFVAPILAAVHLIRQRKRAALRSPPPTQALRPWARLGRVTGIIFGTILAILALSFGPWTVAAIRCGHQPIEGSNFAASSDYVYPGQISYTRFSAFNLLFGDQFFCSAKAAQRANFNPL